MYRKKKEKTPKKQIAFKPSRDSPEDVPNVPRYDLFAGENTSPTPGTVVMNCRYEPFSLCNTMHMLNKPHFCPQKKAEAKICLGIRAETQFACAITLKKKYKNLGGQYMCKKTKKTKTKFPSCKKKTQIIQKMRILEILDCAKKKQIMKLVRAEIRPK